MFVIYLFSIFSSLWSQLKFAMSFCIPSYAHNLLHKNKWRDLLLKRTKLVPNTAFLRSWHAAKWSQTQSAWGVEYAESISAER